MLFPSRKRGNSRIISKSFTEEFQREAVRLATERGNFAATADDLGVSDTSLENLAKQLKQTPNNAFPGKGDCKWRSLAGII